MEEKWQSVLVNTAPLDGITDFVTTELGLGVTSKTGLFGSYAAQVSAEGSVGIVEYSPMTGT
jgi:hypothetical protein